MYTTNRLTLAAAVLLLLSTTQSLAVPTLYPRRADDLNGVSNPTSSTLMSDTVDANLVWVLPPKAGTAKAVPQKFYSANMGFCSEMSMLQGYSKSLTERIQQKSLEMSEKDAVLTQARLLYTERRNATGKLYSSNADLQTIQKLTDRLSDIELRTDALLEKSLVCGENANACKQINDEIHSLKLERQQIRTELTQLRAKTRVEYSAYMRAKTLEESAKGDCDDLMAERDKMAVSLSTARMTLQSLYAQFAKFEGGFASIVYDSGWDSAVQKLREANPGRRFEQIATKDATINATFVGAATGDSYLSSLPAILDYTFNGIAHSPGVISKEPDKLAAFPSKMSATLRLSLVGACPLAHPEQFDIKKDEQGMPLFGISADFLYPSTFKTKVTFKYNMYKIYDTLKSSGTEGGLFSTSSWSNVTENRMGDDSLDVKWEEEDPENKISAQEKKAIEQEIKNELLSRALAQFATPVVDAKPALAQAPEVPTAGALVAAQGISQSCGWYSLYCAAGAWTLRTLASVFGSSETEEHYRSSLNVSASETWSTDSVRYRPQTTAYTAQ